MRVAVALGMIVGLSSLTVGCRTPVPVRPSSPDTTLPVSDRQIPPFDVSAVTSLGSANPLPPVGYYRLTAEECRRLACENSSLGNLIEAGAATRPRGPIVSQCACTAVDSLRTTTGQYLSQEARNRTAGSALTLYYKLLELELKSDVLASSMGELDQLMRVNEKLIETGFNRLRTASS